MVKRRVIYDDDNNNNNNPVPAPIVKKSRRKPTDGVDKPTDETNSEEPAARRSHRSGKGTGGQLARMQELERIQIGRSTRPSKLDLATQWQDINPMAPSSQDVSSCNPRSKEKAIPSEIRASPPPSDSSFSPPQPVFSRAVPGQQFGFRLPDSETQAPGRKRFRAVDSGPSSCASTPPASLFSSRLGTSTAPTSRASSVCSSVGRRTYAQVVQRPSPSPQRANDGFVPPPLSAPSSGRGHSGSNRPMSWQFDSTSEAENTRSHARVGHSLSAAPHSADERNVLLEIDEASPSEDERFAEQVLRQENDTREPEQYEADTNGSLARWTHESIGTSDAIDQTEDVAAHYDHNHAPRLGSSTTGHPQASSGHSLNTSTMSSRRQHATRNANAVSQMEDVVAHRERDRDPRRPGNATARHVPASSGHRSDVDTQAIGNVRGNQAEDVVAAHRERNRAPRLPSNSQLHAARQRQASSGRHPTTSNSQNSGDAAPLSSNAVPPQPSGETTTVPPSTAKSLLRVGPATEGADPWQLQYYDPPTRDIIERAKQFSHCDAASINAFPVRANFNLKAIEYIDEAVAERRSRGLRISEGKFTPLECWWPQHSSGVIRLLWEDLCNWRSALRKKARTWVVQRYDWDPEHRRERNIEIAKELLGGGGRFLRDGYDEQGHVNNLAHPALSGLIIDFFYTGATAIGTLFPEVFETEAVPRASVAIAATALKVVLDEMVTAQAEVNFKVSIYSSVYTEILRLMDKCDSSDVHHTKTKDLRKEWARLGSSGATNLEAGVTITSGFDVDLA